MRPQVWTSGRLDAERHRERLQEEPSGRFPSNLIPELKMQRVKRLPPARHGPRKVPAFEDLLSTCLASLGLCLLEPRFLFL